MSQTSNNLFPTQYVMGVDLASGTDHSILNGPGWRLDFSQAGAVVEGNLLLIRTPNPKGRHECRIRFTVPRAWTWQQAKDALCIAATWFQRIGGFAIIGHRHLCHIVARLREGRDPRCMMWAIQAYAASEWHQKNPMARMDIGSFFTQPKGFEKWMEESKEYKKWQAGRAKAAAAAADQAAYDRRVQLAAQRHAGRQPAGLDDDALRAELSRAAEHAIAQCKMQREHRIRREAVLVRTWSMAKPGQRRQALALAIKSTYPRIPESEQHLGNVEFRLAVQLHAHLLMTAAGEQVPVLPELPPRSGCAVNVHLGTPLSTELPPRSGCATALEQCPAACGEPAYPLDDLVAEAARRVAASGRSMADWYGAALLKQVERATVEGHV